MKTLDIILTIDCIILIYIMGMMVIMLADKCVKPSIKVLPDIKERFCTCRGAQFNNSAADKNQANCYANKIPQQIWNQSYAGCTSFQDAGKISYDYEIEGKQLPLFAGV